MAKAKSGLEVLLAILLFIPPLFIAPTLLTATYFPDIRTPREHLMTEELRVLALYLRPRWHTMGMKRHHKLINIILIPSFVPYHQ